VALQATSSASACPITLPCGTSSAGSSFAELEQSRAAWEPIHEAARKGTGTLVYASHDTVANTAVGLKQFLDERHNQVPSESFP